MMKFVLCADGNEIGDVAFGILHQKALKFFLGAGHLWPNATIHAANTIFSFEPRIVEERTGQPDGRHGHCEQRGSGCSWIEGSPSEQLREYLKGYLPGVRLLGSETEWRYVPPTDRRQPEETPPPKD